MKKELTSKEFRPKVKDVKTAAGRMAGILARLAELYPDAHCELNYKKPLELLVATILSAQCTDVRVNIVTKDLFKKYRKVADYAVVDEKQLGEDIRSTGFFRNKAKNIKAASQAMIKDHKGRVPDSLEELVKLPGVGRKTANVVLGNAFGVPGITADTHVIRLSRLMGLSRNSDPLKLERDLMALTPQKDWTIFSHRMIFHGRKVCNARKPDCDNCLIRPYCCYGQK